VLIEVIDVSAQTNRDVYNERPGGVRGEIAAIVLHHTGGEEMSEKQYNGNVALRVSRDLHRRAVRAARRDGVSLNQWIVEAVAIATGAHTAATKTHVVSFLTASTAPPPRVEQEDTP
jgi:hypothetical protein